MEINDGTANMGESANRCCDGHLASKVAREPYRFLRVDQAVRRAMGRFGGGRRLRPVDYQVYTTGRVRDPAPRDALAGEMVARERDWYCEHDWSREKEAWLRLYRRPAPAQAPAAGRN